MIHLFIDTNRYLTFYRFPKQIFEKIKKFTELIKQSKIILYLPKQVENEFKRNREKCLREIYEKIKSLAIEYQETKIPEILKNEDELEDKTKEIIESQKTIKEKNKQIKSAAEGIEREFLKKIKENSFLVDKIIYEIFSIAKKIPFNKKVINKAVTRYRLGNPPGKKNSYGDSVIWESLLEGVPGGENLHFVGFDSDFKSKIDETEFSPFLLEEWNKKKKSKIIPFQHLGDFIKTQIPEVEYPDKITESEYKIENEYRNIVAHNQALIQALGSKFFAIPEAFPWEALKMHRHNQALIRALGSLVLPVLPEDVRQAIPNMKVPLGISKEETIKKTDQFHSQKKKNKQDKSNSM